MASNESYDEATIVSLMTELYNILVALDYMPASMIAYPPHNIDLNMCQSLGLDPAVVSLIQHLPYPTDSEVARHYALFDQTPAAVYTEVDRLRRSRDPEQPFPEDARLDCLLPMTWP